MERRLQTDSDSASSSARSGVFQVVIPKMFGQLEQDMKEARRRVADLRARVGEGNAPHVDSELIWKALQEIDTAHELLRVVEEELHAQADEVLATRETLCRERRLYGELFDAAPEAYLVTDLNGIVTQANPRACELFNLDSALLLSKPLALLIAQPDRASFRDLLDAMSEAVFRTELRVQPRNGEATWISLTAQRGTQLGAGGCIRWLMRCARVQRHEDARRDAIEDELRTRIWELEASQRLTGHLLEREQLARNESDDRLREKERALVEVAHELRGPLGTIAGWLHLLDSGNLELGVRKRAMLSMTRGVRALSHLIEELIEHARMECHQLTLRAKSLNLLRIVVEVIEDLRPLAVLKHIQLEVFSNGYDAAVHGDPWRLQQVIRNLVGNAIKFTPEQGQVRVELSFVGSWVELLVADSGRGIDRQDLTRIFKPFAQLGAPGGAHSGLGLGLSIAQRIVELHGGTIGAESDGPQKGSRFRVRLPLLSLNN